MRTLKNGQNPSKAGSLLNNMKQDAQLPITEQHNPPILDLQRTIGNQAVLRLLQDEEPSPRALVLLEMFTKNRARFMKFSPSEFELRESEDKDASIESVRVEEGGLYWTYTFVTNSKTGFIYVRQHQDGIQDANYFQSIQAENTFLDTATQATSANDATPGREDEAEKPPKETAGSEEKENPDKTPPSTDEKTPKEKPKTKPANKIPRTILPGGWIGGQDQTWLPGTDHHGKPLQQGDLTQELENALLQLIKQIMSSSSTPKELQISVTLFRIDDPTPGYRYAAENLGFNIKRFLETRLPKSIKITEIHKFIDNGKTTEFGLKQQLNTITPVY
jgi:hypothetical protein